MNSKSSNLLSDAKSLIKIWESEYVKTNGRKPDKEALKSAPDDVKTAYKNYWKEKKSHSTNSRLSQAPLEPNCDLYLNSQVKDSNVSIEKQINIKNALNKTWGSHLNKDVISRNNAISMRTNCSAYGEMANKMKKSALVRTRRSLKRDFFGSSVENSSLDPNKVTKPNDPVENLDITDYKQDSSVSGAPKVYNSIDNILESPLKYIKDVSQNDVNFSNSILDDKLDCKLNMGTVKDNKNLMWNISQPVNHLTCDYNMKISDRRLWVEKNCEFKNRHITNPYNTHVESDENRNGVDATEKFEESQFFAGEMHSDEDIFISPIKGRKSNISDKTAIMCASKSDNSSTQHSFSSNMYTKTCDSLKICGVKSSIDKLNLGNIASSGTVDNNPVIDNLFDENFLSGNANSSNDRKVLTKKERFEQKIQTQSRNENYVSINLKKKVFVKRKGRLTSAKYKRQQWKQRKARNGAANNLLPPDDVESNFQDETCDKIHKPLKKPKFSSSKKSNNSGNNGDILAEKNVNVDIANSLQSKNIDSVYLNEAENMENGSSGSDNFKAEFSKFLSFESVDIMNALRLFGHDCFLGNQEKAIVRVLRGQSALIIQSTGSGKSLCYQLPAYMYAQASNCISICVSPLVSLMEDQVNNLPKFLKGVCLHTHLSQARKEQSINALKSGKVHLLFVSPEAIVSKGSNNLYSLMKFLPPIAFVCIDEAHCISEWSHNFRPSYLQVCRILKENFNVSTFLGLTATAANDTIASVVKHLDIHDDLGVIKDMQIPKNLLLSISRDNNKDESLLHLLSGDRFGKFNSIIIYCTRREECERLAKLLRTNLQDMSKFEPAKKYSVSAIAEAYHAGLSGCKRMRIQKHFMSGKLRIVVATIAFGMGINIANIEGIVHYNMSGTIENYVQEIGRAGRSSREAHCHLFIEAKEGKELQELKRHIYKESLDRFTIRKLLNQVFPKAKSFVGGKWLEVCSHYAHLHQFETKPSSEENPSTDMERKCLGHEVAIPITHIVESLDLPEENILTLLCYIQSLNDDFKIRNHAYATCSVSCYRGPQQLRLASSRCPPLSLAMSLKREDGQNIEKLTSVAFPVVEIASLMNCQSNVAKSELKALEWDVLAPSGVKVEFSDLSFHVTSRCDLPDNEKDDLLNVIYERVCRREKDQLKKLYFFYNLLREYSHNSILLCCDTVEESKSASLKARLEQYFDAGVPENAYGPHNEKELYLRPDAEDAVRAEVRSLLAIHRDRPWTRRSVARVLHGISSPNFPAQVWGRVRRFWRSRIEVDFDILLKIANQEILRNR